MQTEIERKFLLRGPLPEGLDAGRHFIQGYLSDHPHVRFRIVDDRRVVVAIKDALEPGKRAEFEFARDDMSPQGIRHLQGMALYPPVLKRRHCIGHAGLTWEIDVYEGENAGLVTAEVELETLDQDIAFPDWIDPAWDITGSPRYANINLSRHPLSRWTEEERREVFG